MEISSDLSSLTSIRIIDRPSSTKSSIRLITFNLFFFTSIVCLHITQLLIFPLIFTFNRLSGCLKHFHILAKSTFSVILVISIQTFAKTKIVITTDEGVDLEQWIVRDHDLMMRSIRLPKRSVIMANHQIYADWLYIWCLAYLAELHGSIVIILKASLKWVPLVGPAMQMFQFIFLNRSWSSDKASLANELSQMADGVSSIEGSTATDETNQRERLALLIFPEGTLVSPKTRPISKKYADKMGLSDLRHCLLPRSTGSLFCIRALHRKIPDLQLIDLTIGYPGIPSDGYGQDYYTLQSIFGHGHSPREVHIHMRILPVSTIPIGKSHLKDSKYGSKDERGSSDDERAVDPTREEFEEFDGWIREQWIKKDEMLEKFYRDGRMCEVDEQAEGKGKALRRLEYQIELKSLWDGVRTLGLAIPGVSIIWLALKSV
ncbi:acyltransferase-domain-containing protein [Phakopsora pachyrhizi]|uniref:Acyltransferase-domain-containing protein n=1 Tax=Phakopsora pachyrhizi TaxID=170000 RepID=A0AAV0BBZ4_PHAPC|nr:acyltransferase-domain-containing protein [Phakopsora pachyrhizi]KAI8446768.1 acyltransferase-domain-containing protein [Phakopsora pachyrhizi]CAH7673435.1 acyltransferase-domain-containing protein [Phakopsora pachyrhizi]CAH7684698.1 acyltransferase-domain-containing protein [Phakopsora pachyrhizi]